MLCRRLVRMQHQPIRFSPRFYCSKHKRHGDLEDVDTVVPQKTTVKILNQDAKDYLMVEGYTNFGFRLNNGLLIMGPMAIFPRGVVGWRVHQPKDISVETLSLFWMLHPKLDVLVLGVGNKGNKVSPDIIKFFREKNIGLEVLPTDAALPVFNFLNEERRYVAGAMFPPDDMGDDVKPHDIFHFIPKVAKASMHEALEELPVLDYLENRKKVLAEADKLVQERDKLVAEAKRKKYQESSHETQVPRDDSTGKKQT